MHYQHDASYGNSQTYAERRAARSVHRHMGALNAGYRRTTGWEETMGRQEITADLLLNM